MSFAARETSRTLGAPIALFLFTYGPNPGDVFAYTSCEDEVTFDGNTYTPIPVYRDTITVSGSLDKVTLEVALDKTLGIVGMFSPYPPSIPVTYKIYLGHVGETEFKLNSSGTVLSVRSGVDKGGVSSSGVYDAILTCEPLSTSMKRSGLRGNYQYGCRLALYGLDCGASQADATVTATVTSVENPYVELPSGWNGSFAMGLFPNGLATWTDGAGHVQVRSILRVLVLTNEIQLGGDISTLEAATSIDLATGCDHQVTGCNHHNNINNYGGEPWIPLKNPIGVVDNFT